MQHTENKLDMTVLHATTTELQHMTKKGVISTPLYRICLFVFVAQMLKRAWARLATARRSDSESGAIGGFPKSRGTLEDYSILGSILGSPILGNYHRSILSKGIKDRRHSQFTIISSAPVHSWSLL